MKLVNLDHFAFEREREHMHIQCTNSQSFNEHQCITAMAGTRNFIMQSVQDCWASPACMHAHKCCTCPISVESEH